MKTARATLFEQPGWQKIWIGTLMSNTCRHRERGIPCAQVDQGGNEQRRNPKLLPMLHGRAPLALTIAGGWKVLAQVRWQVTAYNMSLPWMKTKTGNCVLNTSQPSFCVKIFFSLIFFFFVQKYRNWENQTDQENNQQTNKKENPHSTVTEPQKLNGNF